MPDIRAGRAAAKFVNSPATETGRIIDLRASSGVSYIVPQKIRPALTEEKTDVFFRANRIFGKSRILAYSEGKQVAEFSREHLAPGEIERITLPQRLFGQIRETLELQIKEDA